MDPGELERSCNLLWFFWKIKLCGCRSCSREVLNSVFWTRRFSHPVPAHLILGCVISQTAPLPPTLLAPYNTISWYQTYRLLLSLAVSPSLPPSSCHVFSTQLQKTLPGEGAVIPLGRGSGAKRPWSSYFLGMSLDRCYCSWLRKQVGFRFMGLELCLQGAVFGYVVCYNYWCHLDRWS